MKSYACMRSLSRHGVDTLLATQRDSIPHFSSRYCDEGVTLSSSASDLRSYKDQLLELVARRDVDTVFPTTERDVYVLSAYRQEFDEHVSLVVPEPSTLERAHDRIQLAEAAAEAGVPAPETRLLSETTEWDRPVIVKSRYNLLTSRYVDSFERDDSVEAKSVLHVPAGRPPDEERVRAEMQHDPIVQEFVPKGGKYMFCALYDRGEAVATYQHEEIRGDSWTGGGGVYRKSDRFPGLERVALDLLDHLEWHGLACLEYIRDAETGEWKVIEINPKLWQSLPSTVRADAEFPYYYWQLATGRGDEIDASYRRGVGCHQLYGEIGYLHSVLRDESPLVERPSLPGTLRDIATSCLAHPTFDYVRADDPMMALSSLATLLFSEQEPKRDIGTESSQYDDPVGTGEPQKRAGVRNEEAPDLG